VAVMADPDVSRPNARAREVNQGRVRHDAILACDRVVPYREGQGIPPNSSLGSTIATFPLNFAEIVGQISRIIMTGLSRCGGTHQRTVSKLWQSQRDSILLKGAAVRAP
jgi:hypothetical protein